MLLALVFLVAGVAKLADRPASRQAVVAFGIPVGLATPLSLLLPMTELVVAMALIPSASALWGAVGALALLVLFITAIGLSLARGRRPDCRCFGRLYSVPMGRTLLYRNVMLAALAGYVVWWQWNDADPARAHWPWGVAAVPWDSLLGGGLGLGLLALAGKLVLDLGHRRPRRVAADVRVERHPVGTTGLPVGTPAPAFVLPDRDGRVYSLDTLCESGKPVLLIFSSPGDDVCTSLLPEISGWQHDHAAALTITLVSQGTPHANDTTGPGHAGPPLLVLRDADVTRAYGVNTFPSAVLVGSDGRIGSPVAAGAEAIRSLIGRIVWAPGRSPRATPL